jgi:tRNA(Ile)-lysidine synthase
VAFLHAHGRVFWFGHHQDDVAETLLMRLARGSGTGGLAAPRPLQAMSGDRVHLRPLLGLRKAVVVAALRAAGAAWREDATNGEGTYFRNRVRAAVLPAWTEAAGRDAVAGAARTRELLAEDDAALESWLDELKPFGPKGRLELARLQGKPRALWRRALHRWLLQSPRRIEISRQAFDALLDAAQLGRPTRQSVGADFFAVVRAGSLRLETRNAEGKFQRRVN